MNEQEAVGLHSMYTVRSINKQAIADSGLNACRQIKECLKSNLDFPIVHSFSTGHKTFVLYIQDQEEKTALLRVVRARIKTLDPDAE